MSSKQHKKMRQLFRKENGKLLDARKKEMKMIFKPKPALIPWFIWKALLSIFIKIK